MPPEGSINRYSMAFDQFRTKKAIRNFGENWNIDRCAQRGWERAKGPGLSSIPLCQVGMALQKRRQAQATELMCGRAESAPGTGGAEAHPSGPHTASHIEYSRVSSVVMAGITDPHFPGRNGAHEILQLCGG